MSVVKSKRGIGKMLVVTRANELAVYTIRICSNEKNFPKRYRWWEAIKSRHRQMLRGMESSRLKGQQLQPYKQYGKLL